MITGDHIDTARKIACDCGIINHEEMQDEDVVMHSDEFRRRIGHYERRIDQETGEVRIHFLEKARFDALKKKVKVIARCTSEDKFVFVCGIKQKGGLVGMTGSSIADAEADGTTRFWDESFEPYGDDSIWWEGFTPFDEYQWLQA